MVQNLAFNEETNASSTVSGFIPSVHKLLTRKYGRSTGEKNPKQPMGQFSNFPETTMTRFLTRCGFIVFLMLSVFPLSVLQDARAGELEFSGMFSFSQSSYGNLSYQWTRRWQGSIGYLFFSGTSELEVSFTDAFLRTNIENYQDTSFHDQIYSVQWIQSFTKRESVIQPYVKVGLGQLNRTASGSYAGGGAPPAIYDAITGVLGAGMRIRVGRRFGIRSEATTYLTGAALSTWRDNVAVQFGLSFFL